MTGPLSISRFLVPGSCFLVLGCQANQTPVTQDDLSPPIPCLPDRDGVLTAAELPVALDTPGQFYVSGPRTVELAAAGGGWDLSAEDADDEIVEVGASPLAGHWYADAFTSGAFVIDAGRGLDGVYHLDDLGLWLHGLASREPDPSGGRTLLVYVAPVPVLRLPLRDGDAWTALGEITDGELEGLPYVGTDTYEIAADGAGFLALPYVRFDPVIRVQTRVEVAPAAGGVTTSRRQTSFLFECFGELARADSRADEPDAEFTTAASLRRFAL